MNPLINKISQNLPKPIDFGVGNSEYIEWEKEVERLRKVPKDYGYNFAFFFGIVAVIGGLLLIVAVGSASIFVAFVLIMPGLIGMGDGIHGAFTKEYQEIFNKIKELESNKDYVDSLYVLAKEEKAEYVDHTLSQFRDTYLYRKRSDGYGFAENLQIYSDASEYFYYEGYLGYNNEHRKYINSRDVKVKPYKRPLQSQKISSSLSNEESRVSDGTVSQTVYTASPEPVVEKKPVTFNKRKLIVEKNTGVPEQQTRRLSNNNNQSTSSNANQEQSNIKIGGLGEAMVANYERNALHEVGKIYLANQVEVVSKTVGDGLGYDVRSFDQYGNEKYIEVKTTRSNTATANFTFTRNELNFLTQNPKNAFVYCVFGITEDNPRLKIYPARQLLDEPFETVSYRTSVC